MTFKKYQFQNEERKLIIEEDNVGWYLIIYTPPNNNQSSADYLLDSLEDAFEEAKDRFGVSPSQWINITE